MTATTAQNLKLISLLGALDFHPMTRNEFATWADAAADAQLAYEDGPLAALVGEITECTLMDGGVAVIVSGEHIEFSGCSPDGEPVALALDLSNLG